MSPAFGPWLFPAFKLLAKLRALRGTRFDVFGYTAERRRERKLIADYEATVAMLLAKLDPANHSLAVELASIPERIRGYGHIKERSLIEAKARQAQLLAAFHSPTARQSAAE